jgi:hypothetical protein
MFYAIVIFLYILLSLLSLLSTLPPHPSTLLSTYLLSSLQFFQPEF